jgi:hypothetical protein
MNNPDHAFLILLHELVEAYLCQRREITEEAVTAFDAEFEANRPPGNEDENGDDPAAPYAKEHFAATNIERIMAGELGVVWSHYTDAIEGLYENPTYCSGPNYNMTPEQIKAWEEKRAF